MEKQRFVLAIILSAAILFGWSLLVKRQEPQNNANTNTTTEQPSGSPIASPQAVAAASPEQPAEFNQPGCTLGQELGKVTVDTPLYQVTLDKCGAVATSWIILKNKENNNSLYSVAGNKSPLQLVWQGDEDKKRELFETPLYLETEDKNLDYLLATSNYEVNQSKNNDSETIEFSLKDEQLNLKVRKIITFYTNYYRADIKVLFDRLDEHQEQEGQAKKELPKSVKLLIGPSTGDQGIPEYNFYSIAPEGVAAVGGEVNRFYASSIASNQNSQGKAPVNGAIDWAAVGDTYFAMAAVPSQKLTGLEYRTTPYKHTIPKDPQGRKEDRYLITAHVPIPVGDFPTHLYVGPKDHYILTDASKNIGGVDLEGLINYGFLSWMSRPLAVPILWSIKFLYNLTGSYGVAIILFTIVIYSLFFPLKWRSSKAMKKAQKLAPRMKELQEKIKGMKKTDPRLKELQMEQMRLMKEGNPLGGCLPLLIQMPFLFALYRAITISIDFRQARFLWIPDLSAAEPTSIHFLPILMAGSMMVLQLITPAPSADPMQRKMMAIGMPLLMLWMLWSAPAGLLVYWLVGNIVGFGQQFLINRLTKVGDDEPPHSGKKADTRSTKKLKASVSQA
jgi:YidC/Oxa1 family membrane protein insertase